MDGKRGLKKTKGFLMRIKLYIVTYRGKERLGVTLKSLFKTSDDRVEINIINNHSDFEIDKEFQNNVNIIHNSLRPDWSDGHLSRNWNQAIINGFKDLNSPDCDILVCSQDDSVFQNEWVDNLVKIHENLSFIQNGHGDQFHSYTPDAIKKIGIWDERFCGIALQAADYFWRSVLFNKDKSSIQDPRHQRVHNPIFPESIQLSQNLFVDSDVRLIDQSWSNDKNNEVPIAQKLIKYKYGYDPYPWTKQKIESSKAEFKGLNFITYPYFEKYIEELVEKNYLI
jgi:hypothetical protein